jgi:serine/threonine protein kinase
MQPRDEMLGASVLGRYRIVARLAQGGMGVVYLARAEGAAGFAKAVVVKRVLADHTGDERMARLFVREAKILSNMQHPNIVGVIDFGEEDGAHILVLEYVRGYQLGLWLAYRQELAQAGKGDRLPIEGVVHIMIKVLDALEYTHGLTLPDGSPLEIVHADISPGNILVDADGQVKLVDFGIARMKGEQTQTTDSKSIRGKFSYLPIEALDGSPPTPMTDVYACGVTLYELLAGENPFTGTDETRTLARVISHEPAPLSQVRPGVSTELEAIVARAMSKDRATRFASAKDFARELRRVQQVPEDEATRALSTMAKSDYAAIPVRAGASLSDLEEAWRNPASVGIPASEPRLRAAQGSSTALGEAPTQLHDAGAILVRADLQPPQQQQARPRSRAMLVIVAAGMIALVGAGAGLAIYFGRRTDDSKILVIERNTNTSTSPEPSASADTPGTRATDTPASAASAGGASSGSPPPVKLSKPPAAAGDPLSAAFAKNQPEIEGCFRENAATGGGAADVSVRFTIDKEGVVQRAELSPSDLAGAPLGQCILGVARKTHFPSQSAPATFRIPLRARKAP